MKRPRGRPRKNPIANVPQADSRIQQPWELEASLQLPSTVVSCPRCKIQMPASAVPKHKCNFTSCGQELSSQKPGYTRESHSVALECERQSKGTKRQRSEDTDDANDVEESDSTSLQLTGGAEIRKRDDDDGEGESKDEGENEDDEYFGGEDDEYYKGEDVEYFEEEEHIWLSRGAKRVKLDEGANENEVIDEDIDRQGPLERTDWANTDPDGFRPNDPGLISGYMDTRDYKDGEIDKVIWESWIFL